MTTQQPTKWQGANAWKMGDIRISTHLCDGFSFCLSVGNYYIERFFMQEREIEKVLNLLVKIGPGPEYSEYWHKEYKERTLRLKKLFILNIYGRRFLSSGTCFRIRKRIETQLTEQEWLWRVAHAGIVQAKIEYSRRMRLYFPHLSEEDVHRKLGYKK